MSHKLESVKEGRGMPFLKKGMKVKSLHSGEEGVIVDGNRSMNLDIRMKGEKHTGNYHPQWQMAYYDEQDKLIAEYKD